LLARMAIRYRKLVTRKKKGSNNRMHDTGE
jgi:hypothetical protein